MFRVGKILGDLSSSMAILGGRDEAGIGFDFARQLVAHDFYDFVAGQQIDSLGAEVTGAVHC